MTWLEIVTNLDVLKARIEECNWLLTHVSDDAMRHKFGEFRGDFSGSAPPDPFSAEYRAFQIGIYEHLTDRTYSVQNERTLFNVSDYRDRPYPYYLKSTATAGEHLLAVGFMLRHLGLPPGARVVEFGPGWGNSTVALALLGMQVTAVDIEPNFCAVLRERAVAHAVELEIVEDDFFWAERVTEPYDAAIFFESFHHCDDHMRLLRALKTAVKPGGQVIFAAEPVVTRHPIPWGISMSGSALWSMRNFGWLELGFDEAYFHAALARAGWTAQKHTSLDLSWASVWQATHAEPQPGAVVAPPVAPAPMPVHVPVPQPEPAAVLQGPSLREAQLARELEAVYASSSWRVTSPLRAVRRLLGS